ncbi:MAG: single-stranded-DNA-specific exonuclease RecJ [Clostridia bacterium]|nr:single-stranded-DNA-specific exonuclease RecJ [Clostridia bacterium]
MKKWLVSKLNRETAAKLAEECDLPMLTAVLLTLRGINDAKSAINFLSNEPNLQSPFELADMDKAVARINDAIDNFEEICVYGDYDADGITSTALLYSYLSAVGANVIFIIPDSQNDGYGLNKIAIDCIAQSNIKLIITVDNGITAHQEIEYAKSLGIDTIVTDHHTPLETLPNAVAVVDPHRVDCQSKFKFLSGVGVAFKLIMGLEGEDCDIYGLLDNYSDIITIGTIGDIVMLSDENRYMVKYGLNCISNTDRQALIAMLNEAGVSSEDITASTIAYSIVPRINAMGRLGDTTDMVSFLLSEDEEYAEQKAEIIGNNNRERQKIEKQIFDEAIAKIEDDPYIKHRDIIIVYGEDWHVGVIGIVAAKIKEIYGKPVIVMSVTGDEAKGSCRSIEGFSICDALFYCEELLTHCGGHPMAAGLSIKKENIPALIEKLDAYTSNLDMPYPILDIDLKLKPAILNIDLIEQIDILQPFGMGNPEPLFGLFGVTLSYISPIGGGKHLKLGFVRDGVKFDAVRFGTSIDEFSYAVGEKLDLAVNLCANNYNNSKYLSIIIREIKVTQSDCEEALKSMRLYDKLCMKKQLNDDELNSLLPDRDDFATLYKYIRSNNAKSFLLDTLYEKLKDNNITCGKIAVMLDAMKQLNLIDTKIIGNKYNIKINPTAQKVNLNDAPVIKHISTLLRGGTT